MTLPGAANMFLTSLTGGVGDFGQKTKKEKKKVFKSFLKQLSKTCLTENRLASKVN
jgi:hypothetical protein